MWHSVHSTKKKCHNLHRAIWAQPNIVHVTTGPKERKWARLANYSPLCGTAAADSPALRLIPTVTGHHPRRPHRSYISPLLLPRLSPPTAREPFLRCLPPSPSPALLASGERLAVPGRLLVVSSAAVFLFRELCWFEMEMWLRACLAAFPSRA